MKKKKSGRPPARKPGIERYDLVIGAAERLIRDAGSLETLTLKAAVSYTHLTLPTICSV